MMIMQKRPIERVVDQIIDEVAGWEGIRAAPHRFGGTEFLMGRVEVGHIHRFGLVDIPFTRPIRDQIVGEGRAGPHHVIPDSGWISFYVRSDHDLDRAIWLYRVAYLHTLISLTRRQKDGAQNAAKRVTIETLLGNLELSLELRSLLENRLRRAGK